MKFHEDPLKNPWPMSQLQAWPPPTTDRDHPMAVVPRSQSDAPPTRGEVRGFGLDEGADGEVVDARGLEPGRELPGVDD